MGGWWKMAVSAAAGEPPATDDTMRDAVVAKEPMSRTRESRDRSGMMIMIMMMLVMIVATAIENGRTDDSGQRMIKMKHRNRNDSIRPQVYR